MVVEVDSALGDGGGGAEGEEREGQALPVGDGCVGGRGSMGRDAVGVVADEEEEGQVGGEVGDELGMGGGHAVAFAEGFYGSNSLAPESERSNCRTDMV